MEHAWYLLIGQHTHTHTCWAVLFLFIPRNSIVCGDVGDSCIDYVNVVMDTLVSPLAHRKMCMVYMYPMHCLMATNPSPSSSCTNLKLNIDAATSGR